MVTPAATLRSLFPMAAKKKAKKSGLPSPLTDAKFTESALVKQEIQYPPPGVRYAGYAQILLPNGDRRLLKQERVRVYLYNSTYPGAPNPMQRSSTIPTGYDFYITTIQIQIDSLSSTGSIIVYNGVSSLNNVIHTHQINQNEYYTYTKTFELPLKVSSTLAMDSYFTGTSGSYYVEFQGFLEEKQS